MSQCVDTRQKGRSLYSSAGNYGNSHMEGKSPNFYLPLLGSESKFMGVGLKEDGRKYALQVNGTSLHLPTLWERQENGCSMPDPTIKFKSHPFSLNETIYVAFFTGFYCLLTHGDYSFII
jgi:hypothetical protein